MTTPPQDASTLSEFEWNAIVEGIREKQCIVCVGPEIYSVNGENGTQSEQLAAYLRQNQTALKIRVNENSWFHLQAGGMDGTVVQAIREFYRKKITVPTELIEKLARIQFHLILSLTPDDYLRKAFEEQRLAHRFEVYVRNEPNRNSEEPTAELPMIYNLVGELGNRNSLVLTYDDFFDYLESAFKGNSMSTMLKNNIQDAQYFIFLGLPFHEWHMHLFMRVLRQHKERRTKFAPGQGLDESQQENASEQYSIRFVNSGVNDFVNELYRRCEAESLVKTVEQAEKADGEAAFFSELEELLSENQFERIIDKLKQVLRGVGEAGKNLLLQVIQLAGRYRDIKECEILGLMSNEDKTLRTNELRRGFIFLVTELQQTWKELRIKL